MLTSVMDNNNNNNNLDIPEYFLCPISLQIMLDPVTAITGITYDRESIERWLNLHDAHKCPVTKQTLNDVSDLTPNHTLRRLIQSWRVDRNPRKLIPALVIKDLWVPNLQLDCLRKLEGLALEGDKGRRILLEIGAGKSLELFVVLCYKEGQRSGLEEALCVLNLLFKDVVDKEEDDDHDHDHDNDDDEIIDALIWVLGFVEIDDDYDDYHRIMNLKKNAVMVLRYIVHKANCKVIQRLIPDFFQTIIQLLIRKGNNPHQSKSIKVAVLNVLLDACPYVKNRINMIEANVVFHLIEIGLETWEKKTTELVLGIIVHMCSSADGRAQFLSHAAGVAMVAERLLKVSPAADHKGVKILALICKYAGTGQVLQEMLNVKAVTKLCMILQANSTDFSKEKAKEILRVHSNVWMNSPCIQVSNTL